MILKPLLARSPVEEDTVDWIFQVFAWAMRNLGPEIFDKKTVLVLPTNDHFPGRASSAHEMADLIFRHTVTYAGMQRWPVRLVAPGTPPPNQLPRIAPPSPLRGVETEVAIASETSGVIPVSYDPALIANPEALIAGFAQVLAHYLGSAVTEPPPGGVHSWPQTVEVLGVFLGFGVLFANTAVVYRPRSCASCSGPPVDREVYLSQYDITYALALFCALKEVPDRLVLSQLRRSLRGHFKRCRREIGRRSGALAQLHGALARYPAPEVANDEPGPAVMTRAGEDA